jgi:hypothetical protein
LKKIKFMRPILVSCFFSILFASSGLAQNAAVEGKANDPTRQAIPFCAVSLLNGSDSSLVKAGLADESGIFTFEHLKAGNYFLELYFSGYKKTASALFALNEDEKKTLDPISLEVMSVALKEAEVVAQKPFIEYSAGKTTVNVENSIVSTGSTVYDVLERSPGISIDQDGNISLKGKTGVNVTIDGKSMHMSAEQLANYLKGMQSSTVEKIELIYNPTSKYDAEGTAGIINIKTKKGKKDGLNSSVYASYGQGRYEKINAGLSFNLKKKWFNWFGNYDYGKRRDFYDLNLDRTFYSLDTPSTKYSQHNYVVFPMNIHSGKLGCDITAGKKNSVGFMLSGSSNRFHSSGYSNSSTMNGHDDVLYYFNTINGSDESRENASANINFRRDIDSTGRELRADLDYAWYNGPIAQNFDNTYLATDGTQFLPPTSISTSVKAGLQIFSGKLDYTHPFNKSAKMEAGIKSSYVTADNDKVFYNTVNGVEALDTGKTNHFLYDENINAAYITLSKDFKKLSVELGLRGEQTLVHGNQVTNKTVFSRNYAQLFPSTFFTWNPNDKNSFTLSYSRRINRPNYQSLNPFILYVDPTFYKMGNPYLDAELSDNFDCGYSFGQNFSLSAYYNYNTRTVSAVLLQDNLNKITIQTEQNMDHVEYYGASLNVTLKPFKWWNSYNTIDVYRGTYNGSQQGQSYERGNNVFSINTYNSFAFSHGFSAELSFFYKTRELYSVLDINPASSLTAGIKKTFLEKKLTAKLNFTDILYMNNTSGQVVFSTIDEQFARKRDTRVLTASLAYNIGKGGSTAALKRQSGAEDEKKRAGS